MKKYIPILLLTLLMVKISNAQRYYGIANSNYAATNGLYINPANIADNRMLMDLNFFSVNFAVNQNYGYIKNFRSFTDALNNGKDIEFTRSSKTENIGFSLLGEVRGPSFMMQIGKKQAIGLLTRGRVVASGTGINTDYFTFINDGIRGVKLANGTTFTSGNVNTNVHAFTEIGIAYGREILNEGSNYVKIGAVLKRYNGLAFSSARLDNFSVKLLDTSLSKVQYDGSIIASKSFSNSNGFDNLTSKNILFNGAGSGVGIDIGGVYEYRDGEEISTARYENKYKYKIGFAIQDLGSMKYKASPDNENYIINTNGPKTVSSADTARLGFDDITSYFKSIPGVTSTKDNGAVKVKAPTVITIYGDYKFSKHIYINALFTGGLVGNKTAGTRTPFQAVITPRFEGTFLDAGLPISYNGLSKDVKVGLGLRLGIFYIGSDDLISSSTGLSKFTSANVYLGLHAAIPYRKPKSKRDKDEDETPVVKEPKVVAPIVEPAKVEAPKDTDGDGIIDSEDKCPTVAGLKAFAGCPDTDNDGIQDSEDKCPTVAGIKAFDGCPDTDADGVQDSEDDCPTVKGLAALKGCPDTDGDGVADKDDKCVDRPGPVDNEGCPRVSEVVKKKLDFAAKAIQFEVGKDILRPISFGQLDEVVKILKEYDDYQIIIDGHTDNTGKADKNQILSDKRAAAVKNYFVKKGIDASRMISTGYGDTKPLVENNSVPNKAKNRRVELSMKLKD
jgi:outer membrane protein OmpA-like peptidoglycan-associated protein